MSRGGEMGRAPRATAQSAMWAGTRPLRIKCPASGKWLNTGLSLDAGRFAGLEDVERIVERCPHCGKPHLWRKQQARPIGD